MSLAQTVVRLVRRLGPVKPDALLPHLPEFTRAQVMNAMRCAVFQGWLECKRGKALGYRKGREPATYSARSERLKRAKKLRPKAPVRLSPVRGHIVAYLKAVGSATTEEIYEAVKHHGLTMRQIRTSLTTGKCDGKFYSSGQKPRSGFAKGYGFATYSLTDISGKRVNFSDEAELFKPNRREERKPAFASVFHYGSGITTEAA
jgi:hypothetical protein